MQTKTPWTKEEEKILLNNYYNLTTKELQKLLPNRTIQSIRAHANDINLNKNKYWTKEEAKFLIENISTKSKKELEIILNRSWSAITGFMFRHKIKGSTDKLKNGKPSLSPLLTETPEAYYWIGFILADGYYSDKTSRIYLGIKDTDIEHFKNYAKFVNSKIYMMKMKSGFTQKKVNMCTVTIHDKILSKEISKKFDIKPRKTYDPPSSEILCKTLDKKWKFLALLIGFIDGDGCIKKKGDSIEFENHKSWISFYKFIENRLFLCDIKSTKPRFNKRDRVIMRICGRNTLAKFKRFIKKYNLQVMSRKWSRIKD